MSYSEGDRRGGEPDSAYVVEIKTVQALAFKALFEGLKELLTDVPLEIDASGIRLSALDTSHVVLTNVRLSADRFDYYHVSEERIRIGINVLQLCKLLRSVSNSDTLTLFMEDAAGNLGIRIESRERNAKTVFNLNLLDLPDEESCPITGSASFDDIVILDSGDMQRLCRDMNAIADSVEIRIVRGEVTFSCKGEFCTQETVLYNMKDDGCGSGYEGGDQRGKRGPGGPRGDASSPQPPDGPHGGMQPYSPSDEIQHGIFSLKFMTHFTKFGALSDVVEILLRNNFPLCVRYNVASLGELKLAIAPQLPD
jgi:proliferating cell nuclear antigen